MGFNSALKRLIQVLNKYITSGTIILHLSYYMGYINAIR